MLLSAVHPAAFEPQCQTVSDCSSRNPTIVLLGYSFTRLHSSCTNKAEKMGKSEGWAVVTGISVAAAFAAGVFVGRASGTLTISNFCRFSRKGDKSKALNCRNNVSNVNMLAFLHIVGNLKTNKRTGWVRSQVHQPESISDHMYRVS